MWAPDSCHQGQQHSEGDGSQLAGPGTRPACKYLTGWQLMADHRLQVFLLSSTCLLGGLSGASWCIAQETGSTTLQTCNAHSWASCLHTHCRIALSAHTRLCLVCLMACIARTTLGLMLPMQLSGTSSMQDLVRREASAQASCSGRHAFSPFHQATLCACLQIP